MQKIAKSVHGLVRDLVERVPPPTGYVWLREGSDCCFDVVFRLSLSLRRFGSLERGDLVGVPIFCCTKNCILRSQISLRAKVAHDETALVVSNMACSPDRMLSSMACRDTAPAWSAIYLRLRSITDTDVLSFGATIRTATLASRSRVIELYRRKADPHIPLAGNSVCGFVTH